MIKLIKKLLTDYKRKKIKEMLIKRESVDTITRMADYPTDSCTPNQILIKEICQEILEEKNNQK